MGEWARTLANNLLVRELGLVALLVLAVVVYYFRYVHAAKTLRGRSQRGKLSRLIAGTRHFMVLIAVVLVAVVGYDRLWPHFAPHAQTQRQTATQPKKRAAHTSKSVRASQAAAQTTSETSSTSSRAVQETAATRAAVQLVEDYYAQHADQLKTDKAVTYRYLGDTTGNASLPVHRVGGFVKQGDQMVQRYEFWVYPGNQFDQQTDF
ncbi:hypothetical protein [Lacticaseibacillus absianus]|uniref:hypothetical protein n=1 Tax=Lacticaseibacillus absianus TaxID=2729623 RepID=UPI0015CDAD3C|nr:hypothetical protein [Lacticaseibacillus absianus]